MHSIYCVHTVDTYLPHVSTLVHQTNYARYLTTQLLLQYLFDQVNGIVVRPDVADTLQMYVYNRYCAFSWYQKNVCEEHAMFYTHNATTDYSFVLYPICYFHIYII